MSYASRNSLFFGFLVLVVVTIGGYWTGVRQIRHLEELKSEETRYTTELQSISALLADYDALRRHTDTMAKNRADIDANAHQIDQTALAIKGLHGKIDAVKAAIDRNGT